MYNLCILPSNQRGCTAPSIENSIVSQIPTYARACFIDRRLLLAASSSKFVVDNKLNIWSALITHDDDDDDDEERLLLPTGHAPTSLRMASISDRDIRLPMPILRRTCSIPSAETAGVLVFSSSSGGAVVLLTVHAAFTTSFWNRFGNSCA